MDDEQEPTEKVPPVKEAINRIQTTPPVMTRWEREPEIHSQPTRFSAYEPTKPSEYIPVLERGGEKRESTHPNNNAQYLSPRAGGEKVGEPANPIEYFPRPVKSEQAIEPSQPGENARNPPAPEEEELEEMPRVIGSEPAISTETDAAKKKIWGYVSPLSSSFKAIADNNNVRKVVGNPLVQKGLVTAANKISPIPVTVYKDLSEAKTPEDVIRALAGVPAGASRNEVIARMGLRALGLPPGSADLASSLYSQASSYMSPNGVPDNNNNQEEVVKGKSLSENAQGYLGSIRRASTSFLPTAFRA